MRLILSTIAVFVILMSPQAANAATSCPNGLEEVSIATWSNNLYDVPIHYAAQAGGTAEQQCIKIVFKSYRQIGDFALALVSGEVDIVADPSSLSAIHDRDRQPGVGNVSASLIFTHANRSLYALVGRATENPQLTDLLGKRVASGTCGWDGDVTSVRTDARVRSASAMTELLISALRIHLPQARLWCGEQSADDAPTNNTVYLLPRGFSSKRIVDFNVGGSDFVIVTTPQQYRLRDEQGSVVYLKPLDFDPFPEDGMTVLTSRLNDVVFVGRLNRLFVALRAATNELATDREAAVKWVLGFAQSSERGSIRGIVTAAHATETTNLGIDHIWSDSGCVVRSSIERLTNFMGHPAGTVLYYPLMLCR